MTEEGSGITLDAVELLDRSGRPIRTVVSGEPAALRLAFTALEPQDDFVFGIALQREDGSQVFGNNTDLDGWQPERLTGRGEVVLEFPRLELAPGRYLIDAAVHTKAGLAFDYACEILSFLVNRAGRVAGELRAGSPLAAARPGDVRARELSSHSASSSSGPVAPIRYGRGSSWTVTA